MRDLAADDVSLRDLYLTVRQGLPLIVIAALLAGGLALLYQITRPIQYEATSTSVLTVPPFEFDSASSFNVKPDAVVSFETYRALALSRPTLNATLAAVDANAGVEVLRRQGTLEVLIEPDVRQQITTLSVTHRVRNADPEVSAALAQAWVEATLATVQASLLEDLAPIEASANAELAVLREQLEQSEAALESFRATDDGSTLLQRREQLETVLVQNELRLGGLTVREQVLTARTASLERQLTEVSDTVGQLTPFANELLAGRSLSSILASTRLQADRARARRSAAEAALDDFDRRNDLALALRRLDNLRNELTETERTLAGLDSEVAAARARRDELARQLGELQATVQLNDVVLGSVLPTGSELEGIELTRETLNPAHATVTDRLGEAEADLAALLVRRDSLERDLATLLPRIETLDDSLVDLQRQRSLLEEQLQLERGTDTELSRRVEDLALASSGLGGGDPTLRSAAPEVQGLLAQIRSADLDLQEVQSEREALLARQQSDQQRLAEIRQRTADLDRRRASLEREADNANQAFQDIADVQPAISYLARLLPSGARVLSPAIVPERPLGTRSNLQVALAGLLGALLATLFVFLRSAIAPRGSTDDDATGSAPDPERPGAADTTA